MKKKILFIIPNLGGGGAEKVLVNLVNALPPEKYEITVRTIFGKGVNERFLNSNIKYSSLFPFQTIKGYSLIQKIFSPRLLYKLLVHDKYDYEIAYLQHVATRILGGSDSNAKKYGWSHTLHLTSNSYRSNNEFLNIYQSLDGIGFVSENALKDFCNSYFTHPNGRVVHNVINYDLIIKQGEDNIPITLDKNKINLCSVGRLSKEKGFIRLIKILGELYSKGLSNWHLYIIGTGSELDALASLAKELGIESSITLLGFHSNPHKFVSKMDLFVCSSFTEGYSTAVTESMILGTPVLTTDCSGMHEIIGNSKAGIIVPNTSTDLKKGLKQILSNPGILIEMKKMASIRGKDFNIKSLVNEFENFIEGND